MFVWMRYSHSGIQSISQVHGATFGLPDGRRLTARRRGTRGLGVSRLNGREWAEGGTHSVLSPEEAVALYSAAIGTTVELIGPLAGGETGATEVRLSSGARRVLKWEIDDRNKTARRTGAELADRLRTDARWPIPSQHMCEIDRTPSRGDWPLSRTASARGHRHRARRHASGQHAPD